MRTLLALLLCVGLCFGVQIRTNLGAKTQAKIMNDLRQTKLGTALVKLMQVHNTLQGPLDELLDAVEQMIEDLNADLEEVQDYERWFIGYMEGKIATTEQNIAEAETDIARTEDTIVNLLVPRRKQLTTKIQNIEENQATNRKNLAEEKLQREQAHKDYLAGVEDYNEAIAAVDEALALMSTLTNPSMLQIKKIKSSFNKLNKTKITKIGNGPLIEALVQLALDQNFSDQGIVQKIVAALNEFRGQVVDALNKLNADEAAAVEEFHARVEQLEAEYAEFQRQLNATNIDLTAVNDKIDELTEFLNERRTDLKNFQAELALLQDTYAEGMTTLRELQERFTREIAVSEQALALIQSVDFSNIRIS